MLSCVNARHDRSGHSSGAATAGALAGQTLCALGWAVRQVCYALQRVYGITFPDAASMKDYQHRMEQAKERDHRNIGTQQELFFFDRMSPGSCFFMPHGTRIYNTLVEVRHSATYPAIAAADV